MDPHTKLNFLEPSGTKSKVKFPLHQDNLLCLVGGGRKGIHHGTCRTTIVT